MKRLRLAGFIAVAVMLAPSAKAVDFPVKKAAVPIVPVYNWTGWHIGASAGYGWGEAIDLSGNIFTSFTPGAIPTAIAREPRGFVGGGSLGYDWQAGALVFGLEADLSYSDIRRREDIVIQGLGVPRFLHGEQSLDWLATFRARLGFTPADRLLAYVTGGLAVGHAKAAANFTTTVPNNIPACVDANVGVCAGGENSKTATGWTIGGGLQYAVTDTWLVGAEYLFYDLGSIDFSGTDSRIATGITLRGHSDIQGSILRGTVTYKF